LVAALQAVEGSHAAANFKVVRGEQSESPFRYSGQ
jgi:hypothetical protein